MHTCMLVFVGRVKTEDGRRVPFSMRLSDTEAGFLDSLGYSSRSEAAHAVFAERIGAAPVDVSRARTGDRPAPPEQPGPGHTGRETGVVPSRSRRAPHSRRGGRGVEALSGQDVSRPVVADARSGPGHVEPETRRCVHPGIRITGGWCVQDQWTILPGGQFAAEQR